MPNRESITLQRDCEAALIPSGDKITLKAGMTVTVTQSLGGSYTVVANGALVRIDSTQADALGQGEAPAAPRPAADGPLDEQKVWDQIRTCYDPEIPVNIVDLGLIYSCQVTPLEGGSHRVEVKMTLTTPGCGMGAFIASDVEHKIRALPGVGEVKVELVWEPPWNRDMMTEAARLQLGLM